VLETMQATNNNVGDWLFCW